MARTFEQFGYGNQPFMKRNMFQHAAAEERNAKLLSLEEAAKQRAKHEAMVAAAIARRTEPNLTLVKDTTSQLADMAATIKQVAGG